MIRSVTVIRFRPGTRPDQVDAFARTIEAPRRGLAAKLVVSGSFSQFELR